MIEIIRFGFDEKKFANRAFEIRKEVFVEEQKVDPALEFDEYENEAQHYLLIFKEKHVGAARWRNTEKGIKLERFAILKEFRNNKLGKKLLEKVLDDIKPLNKKVYLHSQLKAVSFYQRAGFIAKGDIFEEAGIEHYLMELEK